MQRWPVEKYAPWTAQFDRDVEVGVVQHHQRVLAAHLELHLGAAAPRAPARRRAGGDGPGEARLPATTGDDVSASPTTEPRPITRLKTPAGQRRRG